MSDLTLPQDNDGRQSPFDEIRRVRPDGSEYWSARELQPLLGYDQWRNFERCIAEAKRAAAITAGEGNLVDSSKVVAREGRGSITIADVEMTRYGAYMVAMSCDGRKPEVASAKSYFAVRTREAETGPAVPALTEDEIVHQALQITNRKVKELEAAVAEMKPKADAYTQFLDGDGTYAIGAAAKILGRSQNRLFKDLRNAGVLIAKGSMRNTPYQRYMHHFVVKGYDYERSDGSVGTSYTTRVQPSGLGFVARKLGLEVVLELGGAA